MSVTALQGERWSSMRNRNRTHRKPERRDLAPLLDEDIEVVRRALGDLRHNEAQLDHDGSWRRCFGCHHDALYTTYALASQARRPKNGWTREEALAKGLASRELVENLGREGERMRRADDRVASRPDNAAIAVRFTRVFDEAWAAGRLSHPRPVTTDILRWAITFAGDPGDRVTDGRPLPFDRIARSLVQEPGIDLSDAEVEARWARLSPSGFPTMPAADRVEQIWDEMLRACATDADAAEGIDELVLSHSDRLSLHATLQGPATPDGPDRSLDDVKELDPIWTRDLAFGDPAELLAGTGPREQTCSSIVAGAASRLVSKLGWRGAAPDLQQHQAEQALLAELAERFGPLDAGIARRPEIHELAHEIIAEARAEAAA